MRLVLVVGCLLLARAHVDADSERRGPPRWQPSTGIASIARMWGSGNELYGVGVRGAYRSLDAGSSWVPTDGAGPANGVWGAGTDDVWIIRARTIHHSIDGVHWSTTALPMLSFGAALEGMWGIDRERYLFGVDRSDGSPAGTILRSHDSGATWRSESVPEIERIAAMWGSAANDVYAVGSRGVVLHSTGDGAWSIVRSGGGSLEGIWGANARSVYAIGANGSIVHFDGRTWTPRASGVRYTLSSIVGAGGEILVGSADGPPLRSTDGVTWRPLTAMVSRGDVWAADREHVIVATPTGVQFFGDSPAIDISRPIVRSPLITLDGIKARARSYGENYPHARDLLLIAAYRLGDSDPLDARLQSPGQPSLHVVSVTNCSKELAALAAPPMPSTDTQLRVSLRCWESCVDKPTPNVQVSIEVWRSKLVKQFSMSTAPTAAWCKATSTDAATGPDLTAIKNSVRVWFGIIDQLLAKDLSVGRLDTERVDLFAQYALDGGTIADHYLELAKILERPLTWTGFFWNTTTPPPRFSVCGTAAATGVEEVGDQLAATGTYASALRAYQLGAQCEPRIVLKAYHMACLARDASAAKRYFAALPQRQLDSLVELCVKQGIDPR